MATAGRPALLLKRMQTPSLSGVLPLRPRDIHKHESASLLPFLECGPCLAANDAEHYYSYYYCIYALQMATRRTG